MTQCVIRDERNLRTGPIEGERFFLLRIFFHALAAFQLVLGFNARQQLFFAFIDGPDAAPWLRFL